VAEKRRLSQNPRFCDSDLEADAVMLPTLAVQLAVRELNRDACRPAVQGAMIRTC
jgi:hypothetical protein